ncbi:MAG: prolyl oligopeptidase family serine peptidase [Deferribacteres bacterium]|nr:prolyl oligopeptidase family serine peptidase [candidate division KSB1 bacterium]MCB9501178.1 prolyl oligopeptidase family serine peptidase [Deferribacteres bacterium]
MKKIVFLLLFTALYTGCASKLTFQPGHQVGQSFEKKYEKTMIMDYLVYLPDQYGAVKQDWPLMLFLHGAGERGNDLEKVKFHGPPKRVATGDAFPFIIVSPQCPEGEWWPNLTTELNYLLDEIEQKYAVDKNRIYLTGLSMGGYGTWALAATYPEKFAAIAPVCGGGTPTPRTAREMSKLPVWVFHGAKDNVVPIAESQLMVDALKKAGADIQFTIYPEAGHDSWTETYNNPALYEWFLQHRLEK